MASQPSPQSSFLRAHSRGRVGSCHTQLHYSLTERATHASEMPAPARAAREAVAGMRSQDLKRWHGETSTFSVPAPRSMQNFAMDPTEYKYNFRAEVLPEPRPVLIDSFGTVKKVIFDSHFHRTAEMPVHPGLEGKAAWSSATSTAEPPSVAAAAAAGRRAAASSSSARAGAALLSSGSYEGPLARETRRCAESRAARAAAELAARDPALLESARAEALRWTANIRDGHHRAQRFVAASGSFAGRSERSGHFLEEEYEALLAADAAARASAASASSASPRQDRLVVARSLHSGVFEEQRPEAGSLGLLPAHKKLEEQEKLQLWLREQRLGRTGAGLSPAGRGSSASSGSSGSSASSASSASSPPPPLSPSARPP